MGQVRCFEERRIESGFTACLQRRLLPVREAIDPAVAAVFGVEIGDLGSTTRGSPRAAFARQVAMYLAHVVCGLSLTEVGSLFGRDRTTVAHACSVVEDGRDDPELDRRLEHLERAVCSLIDAVFARVEVRP